MWQSLTLPWERLLAPHLWGDFEGPHWQAWGFLLLLGGMGLPGRGTVFGKPSSEMPHTLPSSPVIVAKHIYCLHQVGIPPWHSRCVQGPPGAVRVSLGRQTQIKARWGFDAPLPPSTEGRTEAGHPKMFTQAEWDLVREGPVQVPQRWGQGPHCRSQP